MHASRSGLFFPRWSSLSHGVAERKRLDLGNLNPIYERELNKLDVHQVKGRWNVCRDECEHRGGNVFKVAAKALFLGGWSFLAKIYFKVASHLRII